MGVETFWANKRRVYFPGSTPGTGVAIDGATDITGGGYVPGVKSYVNRVGLVIGTSYTPPASGALQLTLSLADPVNASPVSFAVLSFGTTDYEIGDVIWVDVIAPVAQTSGQDALASNPRSMPTSLLDVAPAGPMEVPPGAAFELSVSNAAQAGDATVIVELIEESEPLAFSAGNVYINPSA